MQNRIRERTSTGHLPSAIRRRVMAFFVVLACSAPGIAGTSRQTTARPEMGEAGQLGRVALSSESSASAASPSEVPNGATGAVAQAGGRVDTSAWGQLFPLLGFLLLIVGVLVHWSRDTSYKDERSLFTARP